MAKARPASWVRRCDRYDVDPAPLELTTGHSPEAIAGRRQDMTELTGTDSKSPLYCSFCGKSQHEVRKLIAGPTVFICDECV